MLIIHGEDDRRVPVIQAIGLMRGLRKVGGPNAHPQLAIYPREPHVFGNVIMQKKSCIAFWSILTSIYSTAHE
jgi:dipeptidyl aminopeptidase/acylaminoacyl peptidase